MHEIDDRGEEPASNPDEVELDWVEEKLDLLFTGCSWREPKESGSVGIRAEFVPCARLLVQPHARNHSQSHTQRSEPEITIQ